MCIRDRARDRRGKAEGRALIDFVALSFIFPFWFFALQFRVVSNKYLICIWHVLRRTGIYPGAFLLMLGAASFR